MLARPMTGWISGSTIPAPPPDRVQFYDFKASTPTQCPRCGSAVLREVPDGKACTLCPWHAVVRESIQQSMRRGFVPSKPPLSFDAMDDRGGLSSRVFFKSRYRVCAT